MFKHCIHRKFHSYNLHIAAKWFQDKKTEGESKKQSIPQDYPINTENIEEVKTT